jgi:hypothetical protein
LGDIKIVNSPGKKSRVWKREVEKEPIERIVAAA